MPEIEVNLSSTDQVCREVVNLAKKEGVETSQIHDAGSNAEALNAPLGGAEIIIAAKVVTAVFVAGSAVLNFLRLLRKSLKEGEAVAVRSKSSNRRLIVKRGTSDSDIEAFSR
jgi:hypothetical protein